MSTFKKLLALTLALAMVLSVSAFAGYSKDTYKDAANIDEDCEEAIELMYALDIMTGDANGNFNPTATITRAEVAKMIYVILNYGEDDLAVNYKGAKFFSDVVAGSWYEGYVNYLATTKLVQGRPDGTFGPNDPVTCAEAAKMLLTAIGYSAEARGYTGANWAQNVLSDAAIIGLLKGYDYNTNAYAPRQWVAVMFQNALEDAYTFDTMKPTFSGLLTSGEAETAHKTMGEKYYDFEVIVAVAMATEKTSLYKSNADVKDIFADDDCVLFEDEDYQYQLEDTGLTVADLGQEYKIITIDGDVVSCRNTEVSVVAEALLRDLTAKTVTGTSSNKENNKYEFTVDEFTGKLESSAYAVKLGELDTEYVSAASLTANGLYAEANGKTDNVPTTIKVIDTDGDGKIDYAVYTVYYYADVAGVYTSRAYGDYIKLEDKNDANVKVDGYSKLYVNDVIDCEDELEKGNYVKYTWDNDNGELDIEVLAVVEDTLDRVTTAKKEVKIGGEAYVASDDETAYGDEDLLVKANIGDTLIVAVDGDMLVVITTPDATATLDGINAQLCVVTDKTHHYYDGWDRVCAVEIMTIDGETAQYIMVNQTAEDDADDGYCYSNINVVTEYAELTKQAGGIGKYLYVFDLDDGEIILTPVAASAAGVETLDEDGDVIDGYWVGTKANWEVSDNLDGDEIVLANTYFVLEDDALSVMTLEELEGKTAEAMYWEGLYDNSSKLHSMVAGFIAVDTFATYDDGAYLYLTDDVYSDDDDYYKADVMFADGTEDTIILNADEDEAKALKMYTLYKYTVRNNKYTLVEINTAKESTNISITVTETNKLDKLVSFEIADNGAYELVEKFTGNEIYVDTGADKLSRYDLEDCIIAVKNTVLDLDRDEDDVIEVTYDIGFVTLDELKEMDEIFNSTEENDDWYFSDFKYDADAELFYVEVYRVTEECQDILETEERALEAAKEDAIAALEEYAEAAAAANGKTVADAAIKAELAKQIEAVEDAADAEAVEAIVKNEHPNYGTGILAIWNAAAAQ